MTALLRTLAASALCMMLAASAATAQERSGRTSAGRSNNDRNTAATAPRPSATVPTYNRPNSGNNHSSDRRPNYNSNNNGNHNSGNHNGSYNRPNDNHNHGNNNYGYGPGAGPARPNTNNSHNNNHNNNFNHNNHNGNHNYGHNNGYNHGYNYGHGPGAGPNLPANHHHHLAAPPVRPFRPVAHHWHRPEPPRNWCPAHSAPRLSTVLGLTFGTALNLSINALVNSGYNLDGYANDALYLRDVNAYNYFWPDATLYYSGGALACSEFIYSTGYPDMMRFNSLYTNFMGIYGAPVNYANNGRAMSATWFAPNRGYITLNYSPDYAMGGAVRYFTTLTLGL